MGIKIAKENRIRGMLERVSLESKENPGGERIEFLGEVYKESKGFFGKLTESSSCYAYLINKREVYFLPDDEIWDLRDVRRLQRCEPGCHKIRRRTFRCDY